MRVKNVSTLTIHLTKVEVDALDGTPIGEAFPEYGGYTETCRIFAPLDGGDGSMALHLEWTSDETFSTDEVMERLIITYGG